MAYSKSKPIGKAIASSLSSIVTILIVLIITWGIFDSGEPSSSDGKSHSCTSDAIEATVTEDGSLNVVDARTYEFEGSYTLTAAVLDPPSGGEAIVNGVSVIDESGTKTELIEVPFQSSWRNAGGPPSGYYAVDSIYDTVYAFSSTSDASKTFVFDYTYTNAIEQYEDVSVLYWQFVGTEWDVNTNNVTARLHLPVPAGQSIEGGQNVYAFGHGDLGGTVDFETDGTIDFAVPKVKRGTFAEMRVAFPQDWTPYISPAEQHSYDGLPGVLEEEREWQEQAQWQHTLNMLLLVVPLLISLVCIIVGIVLFFRFGREHKPQFDGEYWRDVPEKGVNPAVIARLTRWNKPDANDLTAVLMHLSNLRVVSISRETTIEERRILGDKEHAVYHLKLNPGWRDNSRLDAIDEQAIDLVFKTIGAHKESVTLDDIEEYAEERAQSYIDSMKLWQGTIDAAVKQRNFFEKAGEHCKRAFRAIALTMLVLGFFASMGFENFMPLIGLVPGAIALIFLSFFMPRRSHEAVEVQARCMALKRWFKDFTALDEAVPADAKVWGELLVYAYIFGVAEQVVEDLNRAVPEIWDDDVFMGSMLWYYNPYSVAHAGAASADFFGNAFENTVSSAQSVISAASDGGGGFGGGGGFSGGGGGGFGGGGGGFSR